MNKENIEKAIAVVGRIENLSMNCWQEADVKDLCTTEEELHACGTPACFAGHIAVSPEFQADGGSVDLYYGYPIFRGQGTVGAIKDWLGIGEDQAYSLCYVRSSWEAYPEAHKEAREPTVEEIIYALETLRGTGKLPNEE